MSRAATAAIGMTVFLGSGAMMFASLFCAFAFLRTGSASWPPYGLAPLPRLAPSLSTLVLLLSSGCLYRARRATAALENRRASGWMGWAAGLGAVFIASQLQLWAHLRHLGLYVNSGGPYSSAVYALTGIHAAHALVGVVALAQLAGLLRRGRRDLQTGVRLWSMYWHFVLGTWLILFALVFLWRGGP
jgi:cytochrome c oxidase subunit III